MACQRNSSGEVAVVLGDPAAENLQSPLKAGAILPEIKVNMHGKEMTLHEYFTRRTGVIFAVPGAFTPVCSEVHLPGYINKANELRKYVDDVICLCVNDKFIVQAWSKANSAGTAGIIMLADADATLTKKFGLYQDLSKLGLGKEVRPQRFAMIVGQGRVQWIDFDEKSYAEVALDALKTMPPMKGLNVEACLSSAKDVLNHSYSRYSNHSHCGVAIQTDVGIMKGTTFESCAYPNSICGVRAAILAAVSEAATRFDGIVVAGKGDDCPYICGLCREMLSQFGNLPIVLHGKNKTSFTNVGTLLPGKTWKLQHPLAERKFELSLNELEKYKPDGTVKASEEELEMYQRAIKACHYVYTPVSHFPVGAAVITDKGIISGSNVEHDIIGLGLCSERITLCKAIAAGAKKVKSLAVVCFKMESYSSPCGGCRQSLVEFGDYPVHLLKMNHKDKTFSIRITSTFEELPDCFAPESLV